MEAITIHPKSEEQFEAVKAVLKLLNIPFESHSTNLPEHVLERIDKSLDQFKEGKTVSLQTFKERYFRKSK
ncbi:MAG TPA: DUF2683 family protein [Sphingobacterium sp.]|jgi:hypothetical protein|nr:DUF2683 family protein [Sphingobacterium sp.]